MHQFISFTKKELIESHATFRLYILLGVFFLLGLMGPGIALLIPALMEMAAVADANITVIVGEPMAQDAWLQFFSNFVQMGSMAVAIIFAGILGREIRRGTLVNLLTKGMKRHTVVLAKFISASLLWTVAIIVAVGTCWIYTSIYFEPITIPNAALLFVGPWLFGLFIISLAMLGGALMGSFGGGMALSLGVFFALVFLNMVPNVQAYNPITLAADKPLLLVLGTGEASDFTYAIIITSITIIACIALSILAFNKKKI